eukprot:gnl/Dysnectes_brevis/1089_a1219_3421.p1 GENE.gnl/Dysnectes_brevis/1089_a1219_3421~~gnl/Dysnectes_brevis/1089_a1219_3421.p1  ORF type:complete len:269 (+),score=86.76 gnl/Dysnectes_brevis/1089_a1219_3421:90-896(+)
MGSSESKSTKATREFKRISASFKSFDDLQAALRKSGLESSQIIVGIDVSKSNSWTGEKSYGYGLHDLSRETPYERVLRLTLPILEAFDDDHVIPVYRFGCMESKNRSALPFSLTGNPNCVGHQEVLAVYRQTVGLLTPSGPTTLAPMIETAIDIVKRTGEYHILILLTDGDIGSVRRDAAAIVRASKEVPLSIISIGLGDGPFTTLMNFDDELSDRQFDNFQFVNFTALEKTFAREERPDLKLATELLSEIPEQYKSIVDLGLLPDHM